MTSRRSNSSPRPRRPRAGAGPARAAGPRRRRRPASSAPRAAESPEHAGRVRLQRVLAAAGVAARRACEQMITDGRVEVNGVIVRHLPAFVDPRADSITVDGRSVPLPRRTGQRSSRGGASAVGQRLLYIMVNKPERVLATTRDDAGRATVLDLVHHPALASPENPTGARLYPVGRLDFHTPGLVLLTNDGDLANRLTHPRFGVAKTYRAEVRPDLDNDFIRDLQRGLNLKHARARRESDRDDLQPLARAESPASRPPSRPRSTPIQVDLVQREPGRTVLDIHLFESGPLSVADMLREAGVRVTRITRTAIGPLKLRAVGLGQWRELERGELRALQKIR